MSPEKENDVVSLYRIIEGNNVIVSYIGNFNFAVTNSLLVMFKKHVAEFRISLAYQKKIYNILVEALDNLCKHNTNYEKNTDREFPAVFVLEKEGDVFKISTGNLVQQEKVSEIETKITTINSLSVPELKEKYKELIINGSISDLGGAGIGFIDMAIKSGNKLGYEFKPLNSGHIFYSFSVSIATKN